MIFDNLGLSDLSLESKLFLWKTVGRALLKNFDLFIDENDLKVVFCHIDFYLVEHFSVLQPKI